MTVRLRLVLTIFITGALTALGVVVALAFAFERFEHERTYDRANAFLDRVLAKHHDLLELQAAKPDEFVPWLKSLLLFEPDTQLYLLTSQGRMLASTGSMVHGPNYQVALAPLQVAAAKARAPYVMGDDPEHMAKDAVIAARPLTAPSSARATTWPATSTWWRNSRAWKAGAWNCCAPAWPGRRRWGCWPSSWWRP